MKQVAWDSVGLNFWKLGRSTAKPIKETINWYTKNIKKNDQVLIVGGTTVDLIKAMDEQGATVFVADFSTRICEELRDYVSETVEIVNVDILHPPENWQGKFDLVCSDTLINRFDMEEAMKFEKSVSYILTVGGLMKSTVKLGLYPMDYKLLKIAKENNYRLDFWDESTKTIDYSLTEPILEAAFVPHGNIDKKDLLSWYRNRGKEKRFDIKDLELLFKDWSSVKFIKDYDDRVKVEAVK